MNNLNVLTKNLDDTPQLLKTSQFELRHSLSKQKNSKQSTQTKKKLNLFSCTCCKTKSKKYKSQAKDDPASINTKIKIMHFDQITISEDYSQLQASLENIKYPIKMMIRKSSAPTKKVSTPILLDRKFSSESVKSAVLLSRQFSVDSVKSSILLSRKSSDQSTSYHINLSRKSSTESNQTDIPLSRKHVYQRIKLLKKEMQKKALEEETAEPIDIGSFSSENVLLYVCLNENVENCQKCKTLKQIFENQNLEKKYLLYHLSFHELHNPQKHDFKNIPTWLEFFLYSIIADKQNMDYSASIVENGIVTSYRSKHSYVELLTKYAKIQPQGGHVFFSVLNSKFLEKDLYFFLKNDIVSIEDDASLIGEREGIQVFGKDEFENTFLFGGIVEEVKYDTYKPNIGDIVVANVDFYAASEEQFDILNGTVLKVEGIDSKDGWILISDTNSEKQQWISPLDLIQMQSLF